MTGIELITQERQRQIEQEGFTAGHDDNYPADTLAYAALCYLAPDAPELVMSWWPWDWKWWKPKDRLSNLIRAGALIAAEIDRLQRHEAEKEADREAERQELWQPGDEPYEPDYWGAHYE